MQLKKEKEIFYATRRELIENQRSSPATMQCKNREKEFLTAARKNLRPNERSVLQPMSPLFFQLKPYSCKYNFNIFRRRVFYSRETLEAELQSLNPSLTFTKIMNVNGLSWIDNLRVQFDCLAINIFNNYLYLYYFVYGIYSQSINLCFFPPIA